MQYSFGTINVTNGSATVTGNGTAFIANVFPGNSFTVVSTGIIYDVASIVSNTELTLSTPYQGPTSTEEFYTIHVGFTSPDNFPLLTQGDIETATILSRAINKIQERFNLVGDASAISSANVYQDIASGLAATVNGDYFFVVDGQFILYLNNAGVEVEQLRFASLSTVQQLATELSNQIGTAEIHADNAELSATAASDSAILAAGHESDAEASASAADTSALNAAASAAGAVTSELNAAESADEALQSQLEAFQSAQIAMSNSHFRGRWEDLVGSLVVPASVSHISKFWQLLETIPDVTVDEPGVTVNWQEIPVNEITGGNVSGPSTSTDENLPVFDGTTGDAIKDSGVGIADVARRDVANTFTDTITLSKNQNTTTEFSVTNSDTGNDSRSQVAVVAGPVRTIFGSQVQFTRGVIGTSTPHSVRIITNNQTRANFRESGQITLGGFSSFAQDVAVQGTFRVTGITTMDADVSVTGAITATTFGKVGSYTVAGAGTLGAATAGEGAIIYVTDETGGAVLAFSDGTDWRRVTDRTIIA